MDRTLDCGSSGWWFDPTRGRMTEDIRTSMASGQQVEFSLSRPADVEVVAIELSRAQFEEFITPQSITGAFPSVANEQEVDKAFALGYDLASALGMIESVEERLERVLSSDQLEIVRKSLEQNKTIELKSIEKK